MTYYTIYTSIGVLFAASIIIDQCRDESFKIGKRFVFITGLAISLWPWMLPFYIFENWYRIKRATNNLFKQKESDNAE